MDQDVELEESVNAAAAFEALRREVALLNVAVAGLAAERTVAPDYSETLGEIAKGVSIAVGRLGKVITNPVFMMSPTEIARQIAASGEEARRQDRSTLHQAQDELHRATAGLEAWIESARLARAQNRRLVQTAVLGGLGGVVLGLWAPAVITDAAPESWAWPERRAAALLHRDMWSAGERLLVVADPDRRRAIMDRSNTQLNRVEGQRPATSAKSQRPSKTRFQQRQGH